MFGVTLAMRHRVIGIAIYGLNGLEKEMSTLPTLSTAAWQFTFTLHNHENCFLQKKRQILR